MTDDDREDRLAGRADGTVLGSYRDKLVRRKEDWARQGRGLVGAETAGHHRPRLPPGQHLTRDLPVLDLGVTPSVTAEDWSLTVQGLVERPVRWDWPAFRAQPQVAVSVDVHCVTAWSSFDNAWEGVSVRHLLSVVRPAREARFVLLHGYDGYSTNLPLADFADGDALLAHTWQGRPLDREHGGPVRAVVPRLYFWKSAKWLKAVIFQAEDSHGFWENRGYHDRGDPWKEQRYG